MRGLSAVGVLMSCTRSRPQRIEVLRENQYKTWKFDKSTTVTVLILMGVLPLIGHHYFKKDQVWPRPSRWPGFGVLCSLARPVSARFHV